MLKTLFVKLLKMPRTKKPKTTFMANFRLTRAETARLDLNAEAYSPKLTRTAFVRQLIARLPATAAEAEIRADVNPLVNTI